METQHIKEFVLLAKYLNFSKAAEELYISQSVLSKHIIHLEKELGYPLFTRNSKNVKLTAFGEQYLVHAKKILNVLNQTDTAINNFLKSQNETLTIGVIDNAQYFDVDSVLNAFSEKYPHIQLNVYEDIEENLVNMYKNGEINVFTISVSELKNLNYNYYLVFSGTLDVYCSFKNKLADRDFITIEEVSNMKIYLPSKGSSFSKMFLSELKKKNLSTNHVRFGNYGTNFKFVESNFGITLFPSVIMKNRKDLKKIKLVPSISYFGIIAYRKNHDLSQSEKLFLQFIEEYNYKL